MSFMFKVRGLVSMVAVVAPLALAAPQVQAQSGSNGVAEQFRAWASQTTVHRQMTLRDLGFEQPLTLSGQDSRREIYLPVPAGVPTRAAQLQVDARYVRGHPGRTSLLWAIDGDPSAARLFTDNHGDASQRLGIDGFARDNGFVRVDVVWWSIVSDVVCADQSAPANVLRLSPDSLFTYDFDAKAVDTVAKAWGALPPRVRLLVSGASLKPQAYDAAWRLGTVLRTAGKTVDVVALPAVGDAVDVQGLKIPAALRSLPAYAALASGEAAHKVANLAEVGALLSLPATAALEADVAVSSPELQAQVKAAVDALATEVQAAGADAGAAFASWRTGMMSGLEGTLGSSTLAVKLVSGHPVLLVNANAGAEAAGMLTQQWRAYALGRTLEVKQAASPRPVGNTVLLSRFGNMAGSMDVATRADRNASFELGALTADGRLPTEVVMDVSAAPNAAGQPAVANIFFNDFLLGAQLLNTDGKPQRLTARIPVYALAAHNEVRVSFLRQPARPYCHDPATAFPVSILPSSHLVLGDSDAGTNFVGAAGVLAHANEVFVPQPWLQDAPHTLLKVMAVASAAGVSPQQAQLKVVEAKATIAPTQAFLAFELEPSGVSAAAVKQGELVIAGRTQPWLDVSGLDHAAVVQVAKTGGHLGVIYNDLDAVGPSLTKSFSLLRGDLAVLNQKADVATFDRQDPYGARVAEAGNPQPWWRQQMMWLLILVGLVIFALLAARVAQVRHRRRSIHQAHQ